MTMISSSLTRCPPGRRDEFMAIALEGMKLFERHGARRTRLLEAMTAGEQHGMHVLTNEFATAEEYGGFVDELYQDAEFGSFLARITAADSPLVIESRSLAAEVPLDYHGTATHGGVVEVYVARPVPGRFEACCDLAVRTFEFLSEHGATNCRLTQLRNAGSRTGALVATWEFENMRGRGVADDLWWTDAKGRAIMDELMGTATPMTPVSAGLYRDVHI
jgi:hypothetical protein